MVIMFRDVFSATFSLHGLVLIGAFVTLLPIWIVPSQIEISPLRRAMTSSDRLDVLRFQGSSIALLALTAPISLDLLLDFLFSGLNTYIFGNNDKTMPFSYRKRDAVSDAGISLNRYEKLLFVVGLIITPCTAFLPTTISNLAAVYSCCRLCSFVLIAGIFISSCNRYSPRFFPRRIILFMYFVGIIGIITINFTNITVSSSLTYTPAMSLGRNIGFILIYLSSVLFFLIAMWWGVYVSVTRLGSMQFAKPWVLQIATLYVEKCPCMSAEQRIRENKVIQTDIVECEQDPLTQLVDETEIQFIKFRMLFILLFLIYTILPAITSSPNNRSAAFTSLDLFTTHIPSMCFSLFYTVYSMIFIKSEATSSFMALINAKSEYVRYISHELRTPLSVALIGMEMLTRELEFSNAPLDVERLDIMKDVHGATKTTLDILNDLLTFNKLEAGVFELHKETVPVASFVNKSVALFQTQARENQIRLVVSLEQQQQQRRQPQPVSQTSPSSSRPLLASSKEIGWDLEHGRPGRECALTDDDVLLVDKSKLEQVLRNLLSNAFKFSPHGSNIFVNAYFQELGDDTIDPDQRRNVVTPAIDRDIPTGAFSVATREATTTTPARRSNHSTLCSLFLGQSSPPPPPSISINAFSPQGQEDEGRIGKLVLCVRDEGVGISEEHQASLFQEFVQFNATKLQAGGGSGLGLFICKRVVELHGGTIRVYSGGEGQGSSFIVELPMCRKQTVSSLSAAPVTHSSNNAHDKLQPRPLEIDGSNTVQNMNQTTHLLLLSELNRKGSGSTPGVGLGLDQEQVSNSTLVYSTSWKKHRRSGQYSKQQYQPPLPPSQQQSQQL